jgi:ABC-2 type transport system ATP-binding protein
VLARLHVAEPEVQDGVVVAPLGDAKPEVVNRELVLAGIGVRELVVDRPQLEDVFVALTGEGFDVDQ